MATYAIPQGTTEALDFRLPFYDETGAVTADSLSGLTIGIVITDRAGTEISGAGTPSIVDAAAREVRFVPASATSLLRMSSPYKVRWTFTDGAGKVFKVPNGIDPDIWRVVDP
jgi:hypothetical protein